MTWLDLYNQAKARRDAAAGYYNDNIRVDSPHGPAIVRIPIHGADIMDLRLWPEAEVLTAIAPYVEHAPRLLFTSPAPPFQVHQFVPGQVFNTLAPRGTAVPPHVPTDVVSLFAQLAQVPREKLPPTPTDWPPDGDTTAFAQQLSNITQRVHDTFHTEYADLFDAFAIPTDPLAPVRELWPTLTARPFVCVHADVHRRNMIVHHGATTFLDWELALWGDPLYDLAVHFHKMSYQPTEQEAVLTRWLASMPTGHTTGWEHDLNAYLTHERIKSAIVDSIRYARLFAQGGPYPYPEHQLINTLTTKINTARTYWGIRTRIDAATVTNALRT